MIATALVALAFSTTDAEGAVFNCSTTVDIYSEHNTMVACDYWWADLPPIAVAEYAKVNWTLDCRQVGNPTAGSIWDSGSKSLPFTPSAGRVILVHGDDMKGIPHYNHGKTYNCTLTLTLVVRLSVTLPIVGRRLPLPPVHVFERRSLVYTLQVNQCDGDHGGSTNPTYFY